MRGLQARFRRTVFCANHQCDLLICQMGQVSDVVQENGQPINAMDFDFGGSYAFEVDCEAGHRTRLNAPRDVKTVRGPTAMGEAGPPLTLRTS